MESATSLGSGPELQFMTAASKLMESARRSLPSGVVDEPLEE